MKRIMISPSRYVQGEDELLNLGAYVANFGKKALLVSSKDDEGRVRAQLDEAIKRHPFELKSAGFNLECCWKEIHRVEEIAKAENVDVVIGLGGGKSLDTAKAVAGRVGKPVVIVPTIASTDAPTSYSAVVYTETGEFQEYVFFKNNPNLVLVDTGIIARAPTRFLVAGMGDALATWFEARSCAQAFADNNAHGKSTLAALAIAELCYNTLLEDSLKAKAACDANVVTGALENIVETNILLSGLGFESSGLAAAHAIHNGLTVLEETHKFFHGEKVAFGTIVHLVLENAEDEELNTVINFCKAVGLPTCLADLGVTKVTPERIMQVAKVATAEGETIHNMPFPVTASMVASAIMAADKLGAA